MTFEKINPNTFEPSLPLLELRNDKIFGVDHPIRPPEIIEIPIIAPTHCPTARFPQAVVPSLQSIFVKSEKQDFTRLTPHLVKMKKPKFKRKAKKRSRRKPLKIEPNFCDDDFSGDYDRELSKKLGFKARRVPISMAKGRKPRVTKRWKLYCAHCEVLFFARPTPKNSRYVVNHNCYKRRKQYIIGVKTRGCMTPHSHSCIQRLA
jgi:hypothetical protein